MAKNRPRRGSPLNLTPAFGLFRPSYELVRKNIWIFGPLYALPLIFQIHQWIWTPLHTNHTWWNPFNDLSGSFSNSSPTPTYAWYSVVGFSIFWFLVVAVGGTVIKIMTQKAQLEASEGKALHFQRLWNTVKEFGWRMVGLYIVVGVVTVVGFFLLIVPGLIFLRRYFLAPYVMLDKKTGIRESMDISSSMTKPYSSSVWTIIGATILIGAVSIVPIIGWIASFLLGMFYSVAPALRYQELKKLG